MNKKPIIFSLFGYDDFVKSLSIKLDYELGVIDQHRFPDDETMIRINNDISEREIIFITSLDRPNDKLLPLVFASETAKELGASKITLIALYLAYMRQDKQFHSGEGISSKYFAKLVSMYFDELITIDPHMHRISSLGEIYAISTNVLHASDNIATWIHENVKNPILIGPDMESIQWVKEIALKSNSPFLILEKIRKSDNEVQVSIPDLDKYRHATPILVDDIISTAMTMIETVHHLKHLKMNPPICIGVHAVFSENAYQNLLNSGVAQIVTCNTIQHASNGIDISDIIAKVI